LILGERFVRGFKMNKKILAFLIVFSFFLISSAIVLAADSDTEPFTIIEETTYGLTKNIIYLSITENLNKDQNIEISHIFNDTEFTNQITYGDVKLLTDVEKDILGIENVSQGKYKTFEEVCNETNITDCWTVYYDDLDEIMDCDSVTEDKTCWAREEVVVDTKIVQEYLPLPHTKEKIVIDGLKIEQKQIGIPLPKSSEIKLKIEYTHPMAYQITPTIEENKYDIQVLSGEDVSILDPTWWGASWGRRKEVNIIGGTSALTNFTVFLNVTYDSDMQSDFDDIRFVNGTCGLDTQDEIFYERAYKVDSSSANFWVKIPELGVGDNKICMYYDNDAVETSQDLANSWDDNYQGVWHLDGNTIDSKENINGTITGSLTENLTECGFGSCYSFPGGVNFIFLDDSFDNKAETTMEGFGNLNTNGEINGMVVFGQDGGSNNRAGALKVTQDTTDVLYNVYNSAGAVKTATHTNGITLNSLGYLAGTTNGNVIAYGDDGKTTGDTFADTTDISSVSACIGRINPTDPYPQAWIGTLDEIRFSTVTRSDAWLNRSYHNSDYSLFVFGDEEEGSAPPKLRFDLITPLNFTGTNVTQNTSFLVSVNVTCLGASCGEVNISLDPIDTGTEILYEDFEDGWVTETSNACDAGDTSNIGDFTNADNNGGDFKWCACSDTNPQASYEGNYGLLAEDWDAGSETNEKGIWFNFDASTSCDGGECDFINVNFWAWEIGMDNGEYCWVTEQVDAGTPETLSTIAQPVNSYTKFNANLSAGALSSSNVNVRIMCDMSLANDETYFDNFNITGFYEEDTGPGPKGLINTTEGAIPFYTNETNPINISLGENESQVVTFWVNATGEVNVSHEFFIYANVTSSMSISNTSELWNVTIVNFTIEDGGEDTCTCAGLNEDWEIDHSDACNIVDDCDLGTGTLSFTGTGTTTCDATISTTNLGDAGNTGIFKINDDCIILVT